MRIAFVILVGLILAGCGSQADPQGGSEPTTPQALAAVVIEYAGDPKLAREQTNTSSSYNGDSVGTELRYDDGDQQSDGTYFTLSVGRDPKRGAPDCAVKVAYQDGCAVVDGASLTWQLETPEEDAGYLNLFLEKGGTTVKLTYAAKISGDPRELDLPIGLDTLLDIMKDPRVDLTTSPDAIEAGRHVEHWQD